MLFNVTDLIQSYQYPLIAFDGDRIASANPSAWFFFGKALEALSLKELLGEDGARGVLDALANREQQWSGEICVGETQAAAELAVINGGGYIVIKPQTKIQCEGFPLDRILSDIGQLMSEPLSSLYASIQQMEERASDDLRQLLGIAKHSFYSLACLSEKQIALAPPPPMDEYICNKLGPIRETMEMIAEHVCETLGDRGISIKITGDAPERYSMLHEKRLVQLIMLLFSYAVRGLSSGSTVNVRYSTDGDYASVEIPVMKEVISLFDLSSYINVSGTAMAHEPLENWMFTKIAQSFNLMSDSKIFPNKTKDGQNWVVISFKTEAPTEGLVFAPDINIERIFGGLRPDLMFLSGELTSESYI